MWEQTHQYYCKQCLGLPYCLSIFRAGACGFLLVFSFALLLVLHRGVAKGNKRSDKTTSVFTSSVVKSFLREVFDE